MIYFRTQLTFYTTTNTAYADIHVHEYIKRFKLRSNNIYLKCVFLKKY